MTSLLRFLLRVLPAFVVALCVWLLPVVAHAQTIMITSPTAMTMPPSLIRLDSSGNSVQKRDPSLNPEAINLSDCHAGQAIQFPLVIVGTGTGTITGQVWATEGSADCTDPMQRNTATAQCYRLSPNFIVTPTQDVNVPVKEIIKGIGDQSASTDSQGCRLTTATTFTVWFLAISGTTSAGSLSVPIAASTQGPTALTGIKALPGDTRITVSWDAVGEGGVTNVLGVQAYCDGPDPSAQGASDASSHQSCDATVATDDSGDAIVGAEQMCTTVIDSDGAGGSPIPATSSIGSPGIACTTKNLPISGSTALIPDQTFDKYKCGSVTGTGNTIVISDINGTPLENNKVYAVAVAATDTYGNIGDVSSPTCQFPEPTSDFWRDYKNDGGGSGGGFCSIENGMPVGSFGLLALGVFIGIGAIRRRHQAKSRRSSR